MILVAGATGHVGGEVCRLLAEQGDDVRALVRPTSDAGRVDALRALGAEIAVGDLQSPDSLARACAGVTTVVSTASATASQQAGDTVVNVDGDGQLSLVDAALSAGVQQFVYVSFSGNIVVDTPLRRAKRTVEQRLRESGMTYTILRPSVFMEIWLSPLLGFNVPEGTVTIYGDGTAPISFISLYDVARFAAESVHSAAARNRTIELGGPEELTPLQVVRIAEELTGRSMEVKQVPVEVLRAQYDGASDVLQKTFAGLMLAVAGGDVVDMTTTLQLLPLERRSVRAFMESTYGHPIDATEPPDTA